MSMPISPAVEFEQPARALHLVPAQRTGITFSRLEEYEPDAEPFPGEEPEERDWFCLAPATAPQVRVLLPPVAARRRASRDVERRLIELMTGILEVIDGRRRPSLFRTALADEPYEVMCTTARHAAVAGLRHRLATLHTCVATDNVIDICCGIEVTGCGRRGNRYRGAAARVARGSAGWRFTVLQLLPC